MNRDKDILPSNYYGSPEYPIVLPEVLVTAKRPSKTRSFLQWFNDEVLLNPGNIRVKNYQRAMDRNPNFSQDWDMASNINEGVNVISGGLLNRLSPTQNIGLAIDIAQGDNFWNSWFGNSGIVSDNFAQNHPYWTTGINLVGDIGTYASAGGVRALNTRVVRPYRLSRAMNQSLSESPSISSKPFMLLDEFKFSPSDNIVTHADKGNYGGAFTGHGAYVRDGMLYPGQTRATGQRNFTWWNENGLFSPGSKTKPFARIFLGRKSDIPGLQRVREMNEPVGQWRPGSRKSFTLKSEMVTPEPTPTSRIVQYNLDPYESSLGSNLYVRSDILTTNTYGQEFLKYRDPTQFQQGVRTSGTHKIIGQGPITGSRNVDNPNLPGPIDYHPSRVVSDTQRSLGEILQLRNYQNVRTFPRGNYIPDGIQFDRVTDYTEGFRPSIVKRWTNPENGRTVLDWVSSHNWPMESPSGRWLSNKNGNWMWTDLQKVPVTLFHKKGGKLNEKD